MSCQDLRIGKEFLEMEHTIFEIKNLLNRLNIPEEKISELV